MSEECTHDCSSCSENCGERQETMDMSAKLCPGASVKKVYAVVSGKGGVGKSLVTSPARHRLRPVSLSGDYQQRRTGHVHQPYP